MTEVKKRRSKKIFQKTFLIWIMKIKSKKDTPKIQWVPVIWEPFNGKISVNPELPCPDCPSSFVVLQLYPRSRFFIQQSRGQLLTSNFPKSEKMLWKLERKELQQPFPDWKPISTPGDLGIPGQTWRTEDNSTLEKNQRAVLQGSSPGHRIQSLAEQLCAWWLTPTSNSRWV